MGAYLCKDAEHAKQAKKEDNENAMLPASEKIKKQDKDDVIVDGENPDIPFADATVDEDESAETSKNDETGKVVNDYNKSSVENQESHQGEVEGRVSSVINETEKDKEVDSPNVPEITMDIVKNVESEPSHHEDVSNLNEKTLDDSNDNREEIINQKKSEDVNNETEFTQFTTVKHDVELDQQITKEHDVELEQQITKEHDAELEQQIVKEHDAELEQQITKENDELEQQITEEHNEQVESKIPEPTIETDNENKVIEKEDQEIIETEKDIDNHIEEHFKEFSHETPAVLEDKEIIDSSVNLSDFKDDSVSNADEIILEPESLESEKESSPGVHEQEDNKETFDSNTNVSEINDEEVIVEQQKDLEESISNENELETKAEEHIKETLEKSDEREIVESISHQEEKVEKIVEDVSLEFDIKEEIIVEKQENEIPEITQSEKESNVQVEKEKECSFEIDIQNESVPEKSECIANVNEQEDKVVETDILTDKHVEESSSHNDADMEPPKVQENETKDEKPMEDSNDQADLVKNITDELLDEKKDDSIVVEEDKSQTIEDFAEEFSESKHSTEEKEPLENSEISEEKVLDKFTENSIVDIDLSAQHISTNGNATSDAHESDDQSFSNEIDINGVEDVKEEELIKMVSDAVDEIMGDAKCQVQHIIENPTSKDSSIDVLES